MCLNFWPFSRKKQSGHVPVSRAQESYAQSTPYEVPARVARVSADGDNPIYYRGHAAYGDTGMAFGPSPLSHASPPDVSYGGESYGGGYSQGYDQGYDQGYGGPPSSGHASRPQQQQQQAFVCELPGTDLYDGWRVTTASSAPRGDIEPPVRATIKG